MFRMKMWLKINKSFSKYNAKPPAMVSMNIRENSDQRTETKENISSLKSAETQLMNYTHKSKKLNDSVDKCVRTKTDSNGKKKLNNSTSMNFLGYIDQRSSYPENKKISGYINPQGNSRQAEQMNRAEEYSKARRVNTSMSNLSISHGVNSSKSKVKKKKKATHMKSQSSIPAFDNQHISERTSAKKQYSETKMKKKKSSKHIHHQSEANVSTSVSNKNNILMIDSAIGRF